MEEVERIKRETAESTKNLRRDSNSDIYNSDNFYGDDDVQIMNNGKMMSGGEAGKKKRKRSRRDYDDL